MDKRSHLNSLTWLRAVAAFLVVMSHTVRAVECQYGAGDEPSYFLPVWLLDLGTFGVYLFFALSGCTLYLSNGARLGSATDIYGYFLKRFFRIWPAFAFSMVVYLIFIEIFKRLYTGDPTLWIGQFLKGYTLSDLLVYLTLTFNVTGPSGLFQGPYWSLPVEFQYYLLLPLCVLFMRTRITTLALPIIFGLALYIIYSDGLIHLDQDDIFKMGYTFFGGVFIAALYQLRRFDIPFAMGLQGLFVVIGSASAVRNDFVSLPQEMPFLTDKSNVYGICALLGVFLALNSKPVQPNSVVTRILTQYGEMSYSIYLFHMIFVGFATLLVVNFEIYGDSSKLAVVLLFAVLGSFMFAKLTYRYVELPSIAFGRKLAR